MATMNEAKPRRRLQLKPLKPDTSGRAADRLIELMQAEPGAAAADLAQAIGWQAHSVRGFISGKLKKRTDLEVVTTKVDGVTRYRVVARTSP